MSSELIKEYKDNLIHSDLIETQNALRHAIQWIEGRQPISSLSRNGILELIKLPLGEGVQ